ncbi:hypothetical protein [Ramlibacter albus]|uniref:Uncharacterized protein n=1 Tax=Ramlibacter albus TaxID=2079448 RepID=A0A923M4N8_9BURK|nr:hypothetical protein [Ramlibacter albus]MBC5763330.1 hypothetical protein [Ramlibacter albus]
MLVKRVEISEAERSAFEAVVRSCGREPADFHVEAYSADGPLRSVHVACTQGGAVQYDACGGRCWTESFAEHLAKGCFH